MFGRKAFQVNLILKRMSHHAGPSGYDRLADFLEARRIAPVSRWTFGKRALCRTLRSFINHSGSMWYHRDSLYSEISAAQKWFRKGPQIFHFLYGENTYRHLGLLKLLYDRNIVVCTYHVPPQKFRKVVRDQNHIARLDAVIVVSTCQLDFFSELIGPERVFYVPHGVDVDYFRPKKKKANSANVFCSLFVGSHLRDFETMAETARLLEVGGNSFRFAVVTSSKFHHYFQDLNNVELFSSITDEKLLSLYQDVDALALPILDGTANNSLLEAMACGLPIVSTDLPGVRDYVNHTCALLTPKSDPHAIAEAVRRLHENIGLREKMAIASRARSLDFSWQRVASKTQEIYEQVSA